MDTICVVLSMIFASQHRNAILRSLPDARRYMGSCALIESRLDDGHALLFTSMGVWNNSYFWCAVETDLDTFKRKGISNGQFVQVDHRL